MKKAVNILRIASGILVALVALVFFVLEATLLITLDFMLYERELIALMQLVFKLSISAIALAIGTLSIVKKSRSFLIEGACLLVSTVFMTPFISNNFGIYFAIISAVFVLSQLLLQKARD